MTSRKKIGSHRQRRAINPLDEDSVGSPQPVLLICAGLFLIATLPYAQTLHYGFTRFDDGIYVSENSIVQRGLTWNNLVWAFTTMSTTGNWHPVTWISHMLDCQLFGLQPGWHHLTNVLIHAANTVLLFLIFRSMTGTIWRSALISALFAIHPLHVESVAWIAERKDVLSAFFGLLSIWAYSRYTNAPSKILYFSIIGFFALSLLSKPMLVTLPFVFLLLDLWPLKRIRLGRTSSNRPPSLRSLLVEKLPLLALSVAASVIAWKAQDVAGAMASVNTWPLSERLANALIAYIEYLAKAFWPFNLSVIYPFPDHISVGKTFLSISLLGAITLALTLQVRSRPWLIVGWFWYLGTLIPVIGLIQVGAQSMADRYTYLPLIGVFIMLVWSIPAAFFDPANQSRRITVTTAIALLLVGLTTVAFRQVTFWSSSVTLFDHALAVTERNYLAHHLLGGALKQQGDFAGAQDQFEKALKLRPDYAKARYDLGAMMVQQRDFANALEQFQAALKTRPQDAMIWNGLGMAKAHLGRIDEALSDYRSALKLDPNNPYPYANLGATLVVQGKYDEAIEMCEKALKLRRDQPETEAALAAALWNRGRTDEAILHNKKAIELNPNLFDPRFNLGWILYKTGNYPEAIEHLEYALRLRPDHEETRKALEAAKQERSKTAGRP